MGKIKSLKTLPRFGVIAHVISSLIIIAGIFYIVTLKNRLHNANLSSPPTTIPALPSPTLTLSSPTLAPTVTQLSTIPTPTFIQLSPIPSPAPINDTSIRFVKTSLATMPNGLWWTFQYPYGWHVAHKQIDEKGYPELIKINDEPISLNLVSAKAGAIILVKVYDQFSNPDEELLAMVADAQNDLQNAKESKFAIGENIFYRVEGGPPDNIRSHYLAYFALLPVTSWDGRIEKSVIQAELTYQWPINTSNPNSDTQYADILDILVKSFSYQQRYVPSEHN